MRGFETGDLRMQITIAGIFANMTTNAAAAIPLLQQAITNLEKQNDNASLEIGAFLNQ
jgi:hypothetical protein